MSLFGPIDNADERRWQQRNLKALTELIQRGAKLDLPPLSWTLPGIGDISGKVSHIGRHDKHSPRDVFEMWYAAISSHRGVEPRQLGFRGDGEHRDERTRDGQTRMMAGFTMRLPEGRVDVCLIAEWFAEDLVSSNV